MGYKHVSVEFLETFYNGNDGFKGKMIEMFMEKAPVFMSDMQQHLDQKKWNELGASAHKFKSCIDFVGAKGLRDMADAIEKNAKEVDEQTINGLIRDINNVCNEVILELQTELSTIKTE